MKATKLPNFERGDIVKLAPQTRPFNIEEGALAIVKYDKSEINDYYLEGQYFDIKWVSKTRQVSGVYNKLDFQLMCSVKNKDCSNCKNRLLCLINGVKIKKEK